METEENIREITEVLPKSEPYFVMEFDDGFYYRVESMEFRDTSEDIVNIKFLSSQPGLTLGLDIIEVPTRDLSLLIRCDCTYTSDKDSFFEVINQIKSAYSEVRKFAKLCGRNYFDFERFNGKQIFRKLYRLENNVLLEVRPRLFSKND